MISSCWGWGQVKLTFLEYVKIGKKEERLSGKGNKTKRKTHEGRDKRATERSTPLLAHHTWPITYMIEQERRKERDGTKQRKFALTSWHFCFGSIPQFRNRK